MARGVFLSLMALSFCLLPRTAMPQTVAEGAPTAPRAILREMHGALILPFEYFRQHIYLTVSLNGNPGYVFMLDSGANRNVLNLRVARRLGLKPAALNASNDTGFGAGEIYVGPQENVDAEIDSIPIAKAMTVMDLNRFEQHFHHPTDGLLGYPFFRRFVVKVDYQRKLLTLMPPEKYHYRGFGVQRRLRESRNFVEIPVSVGSSRYARYSVDVAVDTGSNVTLVLYDRFVHPLHLENSYLHTEAGEAYGLNGYYPVQSGTIPYLEIGDAEIRNIPVDYMQDQAEIGPERNLPGAIGNGSLQAFREVIFDVPHRRMIFELYAPQWQPGLVRTETSGP